MRILRAACIESEYNDCILISVTGHIGEVHGFQSEA